MSELDDLLNAMDEDPILGKISAKPLSIGSLSMPKEPSIEEYVEQKTPKVIQPRTTVSLPDAVNNSAPLTRQQQLNTAILSYQLYIQGKVVNEQNIRSLWPTNVLMEKKAGKRPTVAQIAKHLNSETYRKDMYERGVNVEEDMPVGESAGLTGEQIAVLNHLTDTTITKGIPARLRDLGVKPATYAAWMKQKPFNEAIKKLAGRGLEDAIPMAETMLAAQAQAGDLRAIKYFFEVTGRHDPARQQQVDTQALIAVIIDCMQEVLGGQPELLKQLIDTIQVRSKGVKGVLGS